MNKQGKIYVQVYDVIKVGGYAFTIGEKIFE